MVEAPESYQRAGDSCHGAFHLGQAELLIEGVLIEHRLAILYAMWATQ